MRILLALLFVGVVHAQEYPTKTIRIIIPLTPGSGADIAGRIVAARMSEHWKQPVVVENRPGAGGQIGTAAVIKSEADGYTLLVQSSSHAANPAIYKSLPYDPLKDMVDVAILGKTPYVMVTAANGPYKNLKSLIEAARAKPGELPFASAGIGTSTHLAGAYFALKTGIDIVHVPYRGGGATINDLLGGHIKVAFLSLSTAVPHLTTGKIKLLAVVEKARYQAMPDVPTIGETVPGFEMSSWHGIFAPAATPAPLIARLNAAIRNVLTTEAVKEKLGVLGVAVATSTPEQLADIVKTGLTARGELVKAANIQPE